MNEKITSEHLKRAAVIYVRQSTRHQVHHHQEGQRLQYALVQRARELGFEKIQTIDEDMGRSGSGKQERPGFGKLLAAVCEGSIGAVLALEASRLARNNRDWHHLVELCALTEALLIDGEGVYDPRLLNDRLLLGLKGTMSEFELGLLRQRARAAFEQKVQRGYALWELPVGFIRTEEYQVEKTPDLKVQQAVEMVFKKFHELGSARQVMFWCHEHKIQLPLARHGTAGKEVIWRLPTSGRVRQMINNPCYAGAFAYGTTAPKTQIKDGRARSTSRIKKPRDQWKVLLLDHHPGYISWQDYLENQELMHANLSKWSGHCGGAARKGTALLSGLMRCARCGRKLHVHYSSRSRLPRYFCRGGRADRDSEKCMSIVGLRVDQAVVTQVLEAISPAGVKAALAAVQQLKERSNEARRALELALEQGQYEADRARRQYDAIEPENRIVARELESRWNDALAKVDDLKRRLDELKEPQKLSAEQEQRLLELGVDLRQAWSHPEAPLELKKRILRTVLCEIAVDRTDKPPQYRLRLHWQGGSHTELIVPRPKRGEHPRKATREVVDLVADLAKVCNDKDIASILNRLGYRTGSGNTWRASRVASLRYKNDIAMIRRTDKWVTLEQATKELNVSNSFVRRLIDVGILQARQIVPYAPWIIERQDLKDPEVQRRVEARHAGRELPRPDPQQPELPINPSILKGGAL